MCARVIACEGDHLTATKIMFKYGDPVTAITDVTAIMSQQARHSDPVTAILSR
jgi:hypothetical protein